MAAHDWLQAVRRWIAGSMTGSSIRVTRRYFRWAERARAKIRFVPAAPQVLEPRSLMTASPSLDPSLHDPATNGLHAGFVDHSIGPRQQDAGPQLNSVHLVGQAFQPDAHVASATTGMAGWDKLAFASAGQPVESPTTATAHSHANLALHAGPLAKPLQPSVVARVFSTTYVSGSASGSASSSGFSPFDHSGWQFASGFASGSSPSSRTAAAHAVFAASASASASAATSGSGTTIRCGRSLTEPAASRASGRSAPASGSGTTIGSGRSLTEPAAFRASGHSAFASGSGTTGTAGPMFATAMDSYSGGSSSGFSSGAGSSSGGRIPQYLVL